MDVLAGTDFFTVEVLTWRGLITYYMLFIIEIGRFRNSATLQLRTWSESR